MKISLSKTWKENEVFLVMCLMNQLIYIDWDKEKDKLENSIIVKCYDHTHVHDMVILMINYDHTHVHDMVILMINDW